MRTVRHGRYLGATRRIVLGCTRGAVPLGIFGLTLCAPLVPAGAQETTTTQARPALASLGDMQDAFARVADRVEPAVVTVLSTRFARPTRAPEKPEREDNPFSEFMRRRRSSGAGSGVIIRSEGWVLTNDHVVGDADRVTVRLHDGREFVGTVRRDYRSDLALVKINADSPFPTAKLGDSDRVKIGHWAIAIGSPYRYEGSFSVGVISSLERRQEIRDSSGGSGRFYPSMIQTDAAINPGNSGGPLCNLDGEVIGINTAIESDGGGSIGIGFAIPVNSARFVVDQLLENGKVRYGFLGVNPTTVTPRVASVLKVEAGAWIKEQPEEGSPADKAGLQAGDVVTAVDGRRVRNELDLRTFVARTAPKASVRLSVMRDGKPQTLTAVLEEARDVTPAAPKMEGAKAQLGLEVEPLTAKTARLARVAPDTPGVFVKAIAPGSAADDSEDLLEGIVVTAVNGKATHTVPAFQTAVAALKQGDPVKIEYRLGKIKRSTVVFVE